MIAIEVTHWAVQGDRWCDVTGFVRPELVPVWEAAGWRLVTRSRAHQVEVFGELEVK